MDNTVFQWIVLGVTVIGGVGGYYRMQEAVNEHSKRLDRHDEEWTEFQRDHNVLLREVTQLSVRQTTLMEAMDRRLTLLEDLVRRWIPYRQKDNDD